MNTMQELAASGMVFDFIFLDGNKRNYKTFYDVIMNNNMLKIGGILAVDNVLWKGKVVHDHVDVRTQDMKEFNEYVAHDNRVSKVLLPVRDGLYVITRDK